MAFPEIFCKVTAAAEEANKRCNENEHLHFFQDMTSFFENYIINGLDTWEKYDKIIIYLLFWEENQK